jgi:5-methyltetrahydropteroyltriglutamate--homocysteine methyltransferase
MSDQRNAGRIKTTHTGSLPRPTAILDTMRSIATGQQYDIPAYETTLSKHVAEIVRKQMEAGIDVVNDGECSKPSYMTYVAERLDGFEARVPAGGLPVPTGPMEFDGRDARMFPDFYENVLQHNPFANAIRVAPQVCTGPIRYVGHQKIQRDIKNLKMAMTMCGATEGFLPASAPSPLMKNEYYKNDEDYFSAYGEAMREEYKAILDAGLFLQIDFPRLVSSWDGRTSMTLHDYRKWAELRITHLNHTLRDLPEHRIRFHTCYGVNFGPRVSDLQLENIIDLIFTIRAGFYSFEAANPRHEHEWRVLQKFKLPDGKILIPGVVTHSNVTVEHPEVVADRVERWARIIGRENLMVGNDCGFQSTAGNIEIPMTVAWAKLQALGDGARLASKRLWN